ncbi:MAG: hypothetical protein F6K40_26615 [Okeania sp. SIO3I5]|nr:hypothetical protein [Okeania sp. SIO3I5]
MRNSEKIDRKSKSKFDETSPGRFLEQKNQEHEKFRKDWQNKVSRNLTRLLLVDFWNRKKQRMRNSEKIDRKSKSKFDETSPGRFLEQKNQEHEKVGNF